MSREDAARLGRSWYHPHIGAKDAERLLKERGKKGSFLVRASHEREGQCTLSVKWTNDAVYHIKIFNDEENASVMLDVNSDEQFASIPELLGYYMTTHLRMTNPKADIVLSFPLNNPDPTNERWFHGYKSGDEATELLTKFGKRGSYLVRESRSVPGNYVLCVRTNKSKEPEADVAQIQIFKSNERYEIKGYGGSQQYQDLNSVVQELSANPVTTANGTVVNLKYPLHTTILTASSIKSRIDELQRAMLVNGEEKTGFNEEFMALQTEKVPENLTKLDANMPENKPRNRYKNILPFDQTRVKLTDGDAAYINASYIRTDNIDQNLENETYIATQGCLAHTMVDFWRMVLQENTRVIVMTTKLVERGKNKCAKYYSDDATPERIFNCDSGDKITVSLIDEVTTQHYVLRTFDVQKDGLKPVKKRTVFQYHFVTWPDFGVPRDPACVLMFLGDFKQKQKEMEKRHPSTGPIIVHCSAGIGRTGTIIILDVLIRQLIVRGLDAALDIQEMIRGLRKQREGMIQTEPQYKFLYIAVEHYVGTKLMRLAQGAQADESVESIYQNIYGTVGGRKN